MNWYHYRGSGTEQYCRQQRDLDPRFLTANTTATSVCQRPARRLFMDLISPFWPSLMA